MRDAPRLSVLFAYGVTGLPLAALGLPLYVFLPTFYAELPGIGLAMAGTMILLARAIDVCTDPLIGYWHDRRGAGPGLRRATMIAGTVMLLLGIARLFLPPTPVTPGYLFMWSLVTYTGWTLVTVPYLAWGAELTDVYHSRTRVTAAREGFAIIGTVVMIGLPVATGHLDDLALMMRDAAWLFFIVVPVTLAITLALTPAPATTTSPAGTASAWRSLAGQPALRRLSLAFFANSMANAVPASLILLYVEHVLAAKSALPGFLSAYFLSGLLALPLWQKLSRRLGKNRTWAASMLLASAAFIWALGLGPGDTLSFLIICIVSGASLGIDMALPASIQADMAEAHHLSSGNRQTGALFGIWSMLTKLSLAVAVGVTFPLLALSGFAADQTPGAGQLTWLAFLYAGLPVAIKLFATAVVWRLPLTEAYLQDLRNRPTHHQETAHEMAEPTDRHAVPVPGRRL